MAGMNVSMWIGGLLQQVMGESGNLSAKDTCNHETPAAVSTGVSEEFLLGEAEKAMQQIITGLP